jgi:hypothetical protein
MWHVCETGEVFWWRNVKERDHSEDLGLDGNNIKVDRQEVG